MTGGRGGPRAVLFDWDNTLIDSWPAIHSATNAVMAAMGHPLWTFEETKIRVRKSLRDTFPVMFGERWLEARAVVGFFPANGVGDDVEIYTDTSRRHVRTRLPFLRQQAAKSGEIGRAHV